MRDIQPLLTWSPPALGLSIASDMRSRALESFRRIPDILSLRFPRTTTVHPRRPNHCTHSCRNLHHLPSVSLVLSFLVTNALGSDEKTTHRASSPRAANEPRKLGGVVPPPSLPRKPFACPLSLSTCPLERITNLGHFDVPS